MILTQLIPPPFVGDLARRPDPSSGGGARAALIVTTAGAVADREDPGMGVTEAYRSSRDQLIALREDHARAVDEFRWPDLGERFNWAVDWFDAVARGNERPALIVIEEDGTATERSFAEMTRASDRLAAWLAAAGVAKGDPVLLMLGNQVELWESMLAVMKIGAVTMPTTTAVGPAELLDRITRGGARHVICNAADAAKLDSVPGDYTRISVGEAE